MGKIIGWSPDSIHVLGQRWLSVSNIIGPTLANDVDRIQFCPSALGWKSINNCWATCQINSANSRFKNFYMFLKYNIFGQCAYIVYVCILQTLHLMYFFLLFNVSCYICEQNQQIIHFLRTEFIKLYPNALFLREYETINCHLRHGYFVTYGQWKTINISEVNVCTQLGWLNISLANCKNDQK
jgi:hypothetical protein